MKFYTSLNKKVSLGTVALIVASLFCACRTTQTSKNKEAWNSDNNPARMGIDHITGKYNYISELAALPLAAKLSKPLWSGDYWPTKLGGIAIRWNTQVMRDHPRKLSSDPTNKDVNLYQEIIGYPLAEKTMLPKGVAVAELSPAEKYDLFSGSQGFALTQRERERTGIMKTLPNAAEFDTKTVIPGWEGLCHAWAPATIFYEPVDAVTLVGTTGIEIPFGSSDIQALLTAFLDDVGEDMPTDFLSGRCELSKKVFNEMVKKNIPLPDECRDTNPGSLHIVIANQIGKRDQGFIADIDKSAEVWNQGVVGYQSKIMQETTTIRPDAGPGTVKEVLVATKLYYINEVAYSFNGPGAGHPIEKVDLTYWLELDAMGKIIGGEWSDQSANKHPDFLWKYQSYPKFTGTWAPLEKIYREAAKKYKAGGYSPIAPF